MFHHVLLPLRIAAAAIALISAVGATAETLEDAVKARGSQLSLSEAQTMEICALVDPLERCFELLDLYAELTGMGAEHERAVVAVAKIQAAELRGSRERAQKEFLGVKFGLGFGLSVDVEGERLEDAVIVDNTVRVTRENTAQPRIVLEAHHFVKHNGEGNPPSKYATKGQGPFVALQSSGEEAISGFGAGWMWGYRYTVDAPSSFNVALGVIYDANVALLAEEFEDGQPPPAGETEVRLMEDGRFSVLFFSSFSF